MIPRSSFPLAALALISVSACQAKNDSDSSTDSLPACSWPTSLAMRDGARQYVELLGRASAVAGLASWTVE